MLKDDFLFELGLEEIPAGYILPAVNEFEHLLAAKLKDFSLSFSQIETFSTPRRFAFLVRNLQLKQSDEQIEKIGPSKSAAFTADGNLTKAAIGFLSSADAQPQDIYFIESPKGQKIAVKKLLNGKPAQSILPEIISQIIDKISFPKSMRWSQEHFYFARPVRWILALLGSEILRFSCKNLESNNQTYGNRFQNIDKPIIIKRIDEYEEKLLSCGVIVNRAKRSNSIREQLDKLFSGTAERIVPDENLLQTVTDLTEYPTAVIAHFDEKYLELPSKVVISTLSQHQKYFAIQNSKGAIVNKFVFVCNGDPLYAAQIKKGNEKVITARLEDAGFYFREDTKHNLSDLIPKLKEITFQKDLGTIWDKMLRIEKLASFILKMLDADEIIFTNTLRAAKLIKADLASQMLGEKEFTKLQGYIGMIYARISGEKEEVARAIYEHYLPRGDRDALPANLPGAILAIADKLDTVCGIIGVNMIPTGSKDPFALRRAANGIVQIIDKFDFEIALNQLIEKSFELLIDKLPKPGNNSPVVLDFFRQRTEWLLKQKEIDFDVIESVMHIDHNNIPDLVKRAVALQKFKQQTDFTKLVLGFKRVSNIIQNSEKQELPEQKLFTESSENELFEKALLLDSEISELLVDKDYDVILQKLVEFRVTIDKFFDDVLVNVEDELLRLNRLNLLSYIRSFFLKVADISRIVVENDRTGE